MTPRAPQGEKLRNMSILLVDIGNTRVKWARLTGDRLGRQRAAVHTGWGAEDFARHVIGTSSSRLERILVVSVAGARVDRRFAAAARRSARLVPEFFTSKRRAAGVTTLYAEPWRLGADRLVAVIGAHHMAPNRAVCVVDVGTAVTLDLVDSRGRHLGGAIVPGPSLMTRSLLSQTNGIRRRASGGATAGNLFGRSTKAAMDQGARYAVAAAVDRAVAEARRTLGRTPLVLLTGGAAPLIRPLVKAAHRAVPDLVIRGLAVIASAPAGRS